MAAPVVAATNTSRETGNVTSHTVSLPTGIVSGNLLVVAFMTRGQPTITWPAGWTALAGPTTNGTDGKLEARYRIADGTEGASITVTTSVNQQSSHTSWRITGQHASSAPEGGTATGTSATPDPPSLTASWAAEENLWLAMFGCNRSGGEPTNDSAPTSYTNFIQIAGTTNGGSNSAGAERANTVATEDPGTFGISAAKAWVSATIAIRPVAAGAAGQPITKRWGGTPYMALPGLSWR